MAGDYPRHHGERLAFIGEGENKRAAMAGQNQGVIEAGKKVYGSGNIRAIVAGFADEIQVKESS
jgi:hypothetical protein